MSEQKEKYDAELERLKAAVASVSEHFDTVQIFATLHEPGKEEGTLRFQHGCGNWYARYGQVKLYVIAEDESIRDEVRPFEL